VHFLLSRAGVIPRLLALMGPGNPAVAQGNAMLAVARLAAVAPAAEPAGARGPEGQYAQHGYDGAGAGAGGSGGGGGGRGMDQPSFEHMRHPMELSVGEYRSAIERQRELKLGIPASTQQQGLGLGLVMVGDSGDGEMTEATADRRREAVHSDLLQGGACRLLAAAVSPEFGATPIVLSAAAEAAAALALIADYANDQAGTNDIVSPP
jgi:hypothetical protein